MSGWSYVNGVPVTTLVLTAYQWTNLLAALEAIMEEPSPLAALNTGDWVGEIRWALPQREATEIEAKKYGWPLPLQTPNSSAANARQRARQLAASPDEPKL